MAAFIGQNPDLEQAGFLVLQIVFRVLDAGPGAHNLDVASPGAAHVAQAVLVRDRPGADIGDDFHVLVRVRRKAGLGRNRIVVPHLQRAPLGPLRLVIAGEGKVVMRVKPAVVGGAKRSKGAKFDHGYSPARKVPCC